MSISLIIYAVLGIAVLATLASVFRAFNAPKVEASKAEESKDTVKEVIVHGETREDVVKARLSTRLERRWWRMGNTTAPTLPDALDPKPNRPL